MPSILLVLLCLVESKLGFAQHIARPWLIEGLKAEKARARCEELTGLNNFQRNLCKQHRDAKMKLTIAADMAHEQCMTEFKFNRWNCSFDNIVKLNASVSVTKETSYVTAIGSAAIVHQVARACADGAIRSCGCGVNSEYSMACDDNIKYGIVFARRYLDSPLEVQQPPTVSISRTTDDIIRSAVNIHNNNAGRQVVDKTARTKCACYGLSGSCTTYTCYKQVASFAEIGRQLYKRYKEAVKVKSVFTPTKTTKLAFIDESPDYCNRNTTAGIAGTGGRSCLPRPHQPRNHTSHIYKSEDCNDLCCGRGYSATKKSRIVACNCRFEWCCEVVCDECNHTYYIYTCND